MNAGIYLVKGSDQLVQMDGQPGYSEDLLQQFLEKYRCPSTLRSIATEDGSVIDFP